jgi:glycerophosphoryl diester phosphodiesterase
MKQEISLLYANRSQTPLIIAHRGSAQPAAENTIAAFEAAIARSANLIEFDVRSTQDQVLVVYHDPEVNRRPIQQLTWAVLQALNPAIPSLAETLQCCQGRIRLDVELKEVGQEKAAIEQLLRHLSPDQFVVTSFNLKSLQTIKRIDSNITIGLLLNRSWRNRLTTRQTQALQSQIIDLQPNFLAPHKTLLKTRWLERLNVQRLPYWVWTVNNADRMADLSQNPQVHAIITDDVALGLEIQAAAPRA